jgi:hypothetical protein
MGLRDELRLAFTVPRWAWDFYRTHLPVVVGLSLVPSVQRLVVVNWGERFPPVVTVTSEVVVMAVRLLLVVMIWRLAEPKVALDVPRARRFVAAHRTSLQLQCFLFVLAILVFKVGPDRVGDLLPADERHPYLAVLLFLKNPTIIAFSLVWVVGTVRQVLGAATVEETA